MTPPSTSHVARVRTEELVMGDITTGLVDSDCVSEVIEVSLLAMATRTMTTQFDINIKVVTLKETISRTKPKVASFPGHVGETFSYTALEQG